MSSVASVNPAVSNLIQTLSGGGSTPLSSALSSQAVQTALEKASPADIVALSNQALQLEQVNGLFGNSGTSETPAQQELSALFGTGASYGDSTEDTAGNSTVSLLG